MPQTAAAPVDARGYQAHGCRPPRRWLRSGEQHPRAGMPGCHIPTPGRYASAYDLAGNRLSATINGAITSQQYNAANQVIGWQYDAAGNLLSDGSTTRRYDALNRLTQQDTTSYAYNGDGVLVQAGTTRYTQDLAAPLAQILNDSSTGLGAGGTASYIYGLDRLASSAGAWYLGDALGSLR